MSKEIKFVPEFVFRLFSTFRKWKLSFYKKKKIKEDKKLGNKFYYLKFYISIDDAINPQQSIKEYEMIVPADASFLAKRKVEKVIMNKLRIDFTDIESLSEEDVEYHIKTRKEYKKQKGL